MFFLKKDAFLLSKKKKVLPSFCSLFFLLKVLLISDVCLTLKCISNVLIPTGKYWPEIHEPVLERSVCVHTGAVEFHAFRHRPDPNRTDKTDHFLQMVEAEWLFNLWVYVALKNGKRKKNQIASKSETSLGLTLNIVSFCYTFFSLALLLPMSSLAVKIKT